MKKLVSKLLGCLIAFTPVSSFNSNNYSYADLSSNKRVLTEQEFDDICSKIDEDLREYIDHYWENVREKTENGKRDMHSVFCGYQNNWDNSQKLGERIKFLDENMSIDDAKFEILGYNRVLPAASCRNFVLYFAKKYFANKNIRFSAVMLGSDNGYVIKGKKVIEAHVFLVGCYVDKVTQKIKYVAIDPMKHCQQLVLEKELEEKLKSNEISREDFDNEMCRWYMRSFHNQFGPIEDFSFPAYSNIDNYKKFLKVPLDVYYIYSMDNITYGKILTNERTAEFGDKLDCVLERPFEGWTDLNNVIGKMYPYNFLNFRKKLKDYSMPVRRKMSYFNRYGMPHVYSFLSDPTLFNGFSKY